jgi:recombination protein RecA
MFGNPETTPGGRALKFYSSQRLEIRRVTTIKDNANAVGNKVRVKVVKNKVAPPFKMAEFDIMYGEGIPYIGDVLDLAVTADIVQKMGAWYSYKDEKIGQGRENTKAYLEENTEMMSKIVKQVKGFMGVFFKICFSILSSLPNFFIFI